MKTFPYLSLSFLAAFTFLGTGIAGCGKQKDLVAIQSGFEDTPQAAPVAVPLYEASGIADCTRNKSGLWVIEDSGNPAELLLLQKDGSSVRRFPLRDGTNTDWEDLILINGDIYIADMGDNTKSRKECTIYRFPEPELTADTIYNYQKIRFMYPDRPHDAEGFLVDPGTRDIFIITKSDPASAVYKLSYPYRYTQTDTLAKVADLPYNGVTAASISRDGKEILVKTYRKIYYYQRKGTQSLDQALSGEPRELSYRMEPQGESVAFADDGSGFYTLSERGFSRSVNLFFYQRK